MLKRITEPGTYTVTVIDSGFGKTPNTGTEYFEVIFSTPDGLEISNKFWLSAGAFKRTCENLIEVFAWNGDWDTICEQISGKDCEIIVEPDENEDGSVRLNRKGEPFMEVKWVNRIRELKKESRPDLNARFARLGINVNSKPPHQRTPNDTGRPRTGGQKSGGNPW